MTTIKTQDVVFRDDLYPRIKHDPALVQKYATDLEVLPDIEVNQHNELIDGWHRWTAYKTNEVDEIPVKVTETKTEAEFLSLAISRNASHGKQLEEKDKKSMACKLYDRGSGFTHEEIANILSVSKRTVSNYLHDTDRRLKEERKEKIREMWLACFSQEEICDALSLTRDQVRAETELLGNMETFPKYPKVECEYQNFDPPLYNVWTFAKKTNEVSHFGNTEQRIVDNLIYLYTEPFDIVVDPFAGGASTIDICQKRLRRYWVSDRKPIEARKHEIRQHDIADGPPALNKRWSDVSLTYLDPPYWKQAENKYSSDAEDLANMSVQDFTDSMSKLVTSIASKQSKGAIALIIQPTQWNSPDRQFTDHITDIIKAVKSKHLTLANRISCPYSTQQCTPQMVEWAKENKKCLVLSRELIIWEVSR